MLRGGGKDVDSDVEVVIVVMLDGWFNTRYPPVAAREANEYLSPLRSMQEMQRCQNQRVVQVDRLGCWLRLTDEVLEVSEKYEAD